MSSCFLFFSAQYLPTAGGVERFTNHLARQLVQRGNQVIVATSALPNLPAHEITEEGIEIYRFPSWLLMGGRLPVIRPGSRFHALSKELWSHPIDYCVINTYFYPLSLYASHQTKRRHIPTIAINHGSAWLMTGNPILAWAGRIYERAAAHFVYRHCKRFFGVSEAAKQWVESFHIPAEGIITNAVDPDAILQTVDKDTDWRQCLHLADDAKIIAFVGRMIPEKGVDQLISAMQTIRAQQPSAVLLMAGTGPLLENYSNDPENGIFLLGVQPYEKALALLQQADVFCLPSRSEGFACTVLEAAALGCPVLTTATGGSPQLLITPEYGTLLESMDASVIAQACIQALGNDAWRQRASVLTEQRLRENYTWTCSVRQLLAAFGKETD